jgi:iron complex transport system substrate-binding protein
VCIAETQRSRDAVRELNAITGIIVNAAFGIHSALGPGLLESVYERLLTRDLERNGLRVDRQQTQSFEFEGMRFKNAFRPDLIVENNVIVEVKSAAATAVIHERQLHTYLKLLDYRVGLLLNFGTPLMKDGIKRVVNRAP